MTDLEKYILTLFNIDGKYLSEVIPLFEEVELSKGDYLLKAGHYCNNLSFIQDGILRIYAYSGDKEVTQWIGTKGYFMADISAFMFRGSARWNIQALTHCTLYSISRNNYEKISKVIPNWNKIEKEFIVHCFSTLEDRVFSFLSMSAEERYLMFFGNNPQLFNQVALQYIASMLGMSPETLSRIRAK